MNDRSHYGKPPNGKRPFGNNSGSNLRGKPQRSRFENKRPPAREREFPVAPPETLIAPPVDERLAKVMARAGIASRRDAEVIIAEGRVTLNGEVQLSPAINVGPEDVITVDGEPLPEKERTRLWLYHKPRGLVTTARDPEGRPTVFDHLPEDLPRVVTIGRLDINTEGLLLLTNDGGLAKVIAHPETGWLRRYKVRAYGETDQAALDALRRGISIDGMDYGPVEAVLDRVQGDNIWLTLGLREGKNREVKRILEYLGLRVNRLIRLSFGPFQLGDLEMGLVEEVRTRVLKDQLGDSLAEQAGVDFTLPVREPIKPFGASEKPVRFERLKNPERSGFKRPSENRSGRYDARPERFTEKRSSFSGKHNPDQEERAPERPSRLEPKRSIWRAKDDLREQQGEFRKGRPPRRGADPEQARRQNAERSHERVGIVETKGRHVLVERLSPKPSSDTSSQGFKGGGFKSGGKGPNFKRGGGFKGKPSRP
jgi:23S rRNA pseudouridine2605 synthase